MSFLSFRVHGKQFKLRQSDHELFIFTTDINFYCKQNLIDVSFLGDLAEKIKDSAIGEDSSIV